MKKVELANAELRNGIQDFSEREQMTETFHSALQQLTEKLLHDISAKDIEIKGIRQ